ncbi:GntR family transcriptional regulator [Parazoarcus communis]|uniref:GntR family transcriptional regulator n=1 Tax=Parazoarcus communis TaxID=41977 RepID=A0A2U8GRX2_9RHOO|nr:PLP-dependent aminotransferase family protein [Parazoarcus communis]AWI76254.1 GntR family transcriptional regulator [Parazoarcus communis]
MDNHLSCEVIIQAYRKQAASASSRARLYLSIREAILARSLDAGTAVPPTRVLAAELELGRNTVVRAYDQLLVEGYLESRVGSGTFVSDAVSQIASPQPPRRLVGTRQEGMSRRGNAIAGKALSSRVQSGAFMPGLPDVGHFPFPTWRRLLAKQMRREQRHLAQYGYGGYGPLKMVLADYLKVTRMMSCSPRQILILNGSHQALDLCARMLADVGDSVWMEDPGYWGARNVLSAADLRIHPVPVDDNGINPREEDWLKPPRMIFVSPSSQYPTGAVLSLERRLRLLEFAERNRTWVIEDDYDNEVRYHSHPVASLFGLSTAQRVIYVGTFSKVMYPGLRLAYLVVPEDLIEPFTVGNAELYREGRMLEQAALAEFIEGGHFTAHIRRMRGIYEERRDCLRDLLEAKLGDSITSLGGLAGLHLPVRFNFPIDDVQLASDALRDGVVLRALSLYSVAAENRLQGMNLGFAAIPVEQIEAPALKLVRLIEAERKRRGCG